MELYAIGDVHGQFFKLEKLIERLNIKDNDILVFLGDYIDRGRRSFEVIDFLIKLKDKHNCVFLKGNHEDMFMDYLSGINENMFVVNGGRKTISSYEENGYNINEFTPYLERVVPQKHIEFFRRLKNYYETDEFIFVHAGIHPTTEMKRQPDEYLFWDRAFSYSQTKYSGKVVVFGHTPSNKILNEKYKICIDTGACYDSMGDLTAVKLPERKFTRQGWTMEDTEYENDNRGAGSGNGDGVLKLGKNFPKSGGRRWPH